METLEHAPARRRRWYVPPLPREHGSWAALLMPLLAAAALLGVSPAAGRLAGAAAALFFAMAAWGPAFGAAGAGGAGGPGGGAAGPGGAATGPGGGAARRRARGWLAAWLALAGWVGWPLLTSPAAGTLLALGAGGLGAHLAMTALGRRGPWRSLAGDLIGGLVSALLVPAWAAVLAAPAGAGAPAGAADGALGAVQRQAWGLALVVYLFWVCSTLRVRSQLRERANRRFHGAALAVHLAALALAVAAAGAPGWLLAPAAAHMAWVAGRGARPEPSLRVGIREIAHALAFVLLAAAL